MARYYPGQKQNESHVLRRRFDEAQFVKDMFDSRYILVVGNEGMLNMEEYGDVGGDLTQYVLDIINSDVYHRKGQFDTFSALEAKGKHWQLVREEYLQKPERRPTADNLSPELRRLLATRMFRVVFTTCFDDQIERHLMKVWDGNLRVVDINEPDSLLSFNIAIKASSEVHGKETVYTYNEPTLFYIFGKAQDKPDCHVVLSDNDAIRMISRWMEGNDFGGQFIKFITSKQIMAIGCNFDDWYMRFFWYILKRNIGNLYQGQVVSSTMSDEHSKLVTYLEQNNIYHEADTQAFTTRIADLLTTSIDNSPMKEQIVRYRRRGSIFLSYSNKANFEQARELFMTLYNAGYGVWFDNHDLFGGDDYDDRIYKAISQCKVFMPLLSAESVRLLNEYDDKTPFNDRPYVVREWLWAARSEGKAIIPVALQNMSLREKAYTDIFEAKIVGHPCSGISQGDPDWLQKLMLSINQTLKESTNA